MQVDKEGKTIQRMFANIAGNYDFLNRLLSMRMDQRWRRQAVKLSGAKAGEHVLDVCCGTADLTVAFAKALNNDGLVIGTDFTAEMLAVGQRKIDYSGDTIPISNAEIGSCPQNNFTQNDSIVSLVQADTLNLPFADNSFDVCSVAWGIRNVADLAGGIGEMARILKPGGRLVILECTQPRNWLFAKLYRFYFMKLMPAIGNLISRSPDKAYSYLQKSVYQFPNADALKDLMLEQGLKEVSYHLQTFGSIAIHIAIK